MDVLSCLLENMQAKEIAQALVITERTVKFHISNILSKTGARNRAELFFCLDGMQSRSSETAEQETSVK
jgi:DNA-binding NarL/FixJ family response regulator